MDIGTKLWQFDLNSRVYDRSEGISGATIYEKHFRQCEIIGETGRSWVVGYSQGGREIGKISKRKDLSGTGFYTDKGKEDSIWQHKHRIKIKEMVGYCDTDKLKLVAQLIGYKAESAQRNQ